MIGIYQTRITKGQALKRLQENEPVLCIKYLKGGGTVEQIINNDDLGRGQSINWQTISKTKQNQLVRDHMENLLYNMVDLYGNHTIRTEFYGV